MTIEEKNLAVWAAESTAIALVPAARFKVPGNYEKLDAPYIIQQPISEEPIRTHQGLSDFRIWDYFQFSVVARTYSEALSIAEKLRNVFDGNHDGVQYHYRGRTWTGQEQDKGFGLMAVDFRIAESL